MLFLIIFPNESREDFCCGFPFFIIKKETVPAQYLTISHKEDFQADSCVIHRKTSDITVPAFCRCFLGFFQLIEAKKGVPVLGCLFIFHLVRRVLHFFRQLAPQFRDLPIHKKKHLINELPILTKGDLSRTRSQTAMKMVLEAGPFDIHAAAVTQGKHGTDETHGFP